MAITAGAAFSASPAHAQLTSMLAKEMVTTSEPAPPQQPASVTPSKMPLTSNFPLAPYERLDPFANGCNMLAMTGEPSFYGSYSWYGTCRAGLADGAGFLVYNDPKVPGASQRVKMLLGRVVFFQGMLTSAVSIPRGPNRATSEMVSIKDKLVRDQWRKPGEFVGDPGGGQAMEIIANASSIDDMERREDRVWLVKNPCPLSYIGGLEKSLADGFLSKMLSADDRAKLLPLCKRANDRAKSDGIISGSNWFGAFDALKNADYGYYFMLYTEHMVTARKGGELGNYSGPYLQTHSQATLCPQITSLDGCEAAWRATQAPLVARRDALMAIAQQAADTNTADRERRAAGAMQLVNDLAGRLAAETPDYARPPAPQTVVPAIAGKKKP